MSLREAKKRELILRVQDEAYRLAAERGYGGTTIEAIAAGAGASPSTVYRTFGTKEAIFLWDELEVPTIDALAEQLSFQTPVDAVIAVVAAIGTAEFHVSTNEMRERWRLLMGEPALECAFREAIARFTDVLAEMFVDRGDLETVEARIIAGAATAAIEAMWATWVMSEPPVDLATAASRASQALRSVLNG